MRWMTPEAYSAWSAALSSASTPSAHGQGVARQPRLQAAYDVGDRADRLVQLVGDHRRHLAHRHHPRGQQQALAVGQAAGLGLLALGGVGELQVQPAAGALARAHLQHGFVAVQRQRRRLAAFGRLERDVQAGRGRVAGREPRHQSGEGVGAPDQARRRALEGPDRQVQRREGGLGRIQVRRVQA
jgi:hypothetical protein